MNGEWELIPLDALLQLERRPTTVETDRTYQEIGIYCFGRGIFHKQPRSGLEIGDKSLFLLKEGDFILQITFAWEGAIAIVGPQEDGMYGSTRYPTFRVDESRVVPRFLLHFFKTEQGRQQLVKICPGSAGRNRVLNLKRLGEVIVPVPSLAQQKLLVAQIEELSDQISEAQALRQHATEEVEALLSSTQSTLSHPKGANERSVQELVGEDGLRNGRSVKSAGKESEIRCLTLSAMRSGRIDLSRAKAVPMSRAEAEPFRVHKGDVYVIRGNGSKDLCGRAGLVIEDADGVIFPDLFIQVELPSAQILPEFFVAAWNSSVIRAVLEEKAKTTSGIWKINQGHILSTQVPVPPLAEQRRIVAEIDALRAELEPLKRVQAETAAELDALLPAILEKAFKGELV